MNHNDRIEFLPREDLITSEDAKRLVACWNACIGIDTKLLKPRMLAEQAGPVAEVRDHQFGGSGYEASMLRELLARIHGDGGHYVAQHGLDKALEDADRLVAEWRAASPALAPAEQAEPVVPQKYDDTLMPFLHLMRAELHANSAKGDRPGWLSMDRNTALLEIFWHAAKLSAAVKNNNPALIAEHSADVGNMAMMLADVCGVLPEYAPPAPARQGWQCLGYMSPKQVERIVDAEDACGTYIPMRKTPAGLFTLALYSAPISAAPVEGEKQ